jgi:hypothetical protein
MKTCVHGLAAVFVMLLFLTSACFAAPVSPDQAKQAVQGWLVLDQKPMGMDMQGSSAQSVAAHAVSDGDAAYYIVALSGGGFVAVAGDDLVEPIVGFQNDGSFDADPNNPLFALLEQDMRGRQAKARSMTGMDMSASAENGANKRWATLLNAAAMAAQGLEFSVEMKSASISDVRVASLVDSRWSQSTVNGQNTYNLYTPNNYVCGCVATAMSQLMRYHSYPTAGVGTAAFSISVDGSSEDRNLRGGDGSGGAYSWSDMVLVPNSSITTAQRQAIGALTHDAGVSVSMSYTSSGSGTDTLAAGAAFRDVFGYAYSREGYSSGDNFAGEALNKMVNPNLDADLPVLLGITGSVGGHAIVCDGYGYDSSTMYHHLNMGWSGSDDAWYNLPTIDSSYSFTSVYKCVYNVFPNFTGEIISGRVLDANGDPLAGVTVTASPDSSGATIADTTDANGIYGLAGVSANTDYTVIPLLDGYSFTWARVSTGLSGRYTTTCGNVWGTDFTAAAPAVSDAAGAARNLLLLQ